MHGRNFRFFPVHWQKFNHHNPSRFSQCPSPPKTYCPPSPPFHTKTQVQRELCLQNVFVRFPTASGSTVGHKISNDIYSSTYHTGSIVRDRAVTGQETVSKYYARILKRSIGAPHFPNEKCLSSITQRG